MIWFSLNLFYSDLKRTTWFIWHCVLNIDSHLISRWILSKKNKIKNSWNKNTKAKIFKLSIFTLSQTTKFIFLSSYLTKYKSKLFNVNSLQCSYLSPLVINPKEMLEIFHIQTWPSDREKNPISIRALWKVYKSRSLFFLCDMGWNVISNVTVLNTFSPTLSLLFWWLQWKSVI